MLFTFVSSNLLHNFDDVHRDRTLCKTSAASYAAEEAVVVLGIIHELVHKSLTEAFFLCKSVVSVSHLGELGIHAGVPASVTDNAVAGVEVLYVVALAGRANEGTRAATEAGASTEAKTSTSSMGNSFKLSSCVF